MEDLPIDDVIGRIETAKFEFKDCLNETRSELNDFWNERNKSWLDLGMTAQCILDDVDHSLHL